MSRLGSLARAYWFDAVVVLLTIEAMAEAIVRDGSENAPTTTLWFVLPALALMPLPFIARRRFPFGGPAAFWLYGAALSFVDGRLVTFETSVFVLGMSAAFLLGNLNEALKQRIGLAVVVGSAAFIDVNAPASTPGEHVFIPLLFGICWVAGFALHGRSEQANAAERRAAEAEREREAAARVAVAEERARIARELHDVVAHSVSVMVLQAGAVRHKLPAELEEDKDALRHVELTGRTALAEMRRLLGAMRDDGDSPALAPQPGVDSLDGLIDEVGRAGLPVRLHVDGEPLPLPRAIDLSAYRIVQEGLTNALKHAHASHADVTLTYAPDELRIEVRDDGVGTASSDGRGKGLVGVHERVKIYGGEMSAGGGPEGGFVLSTRLPISGNGS
ncbi:MAG TPA: sensor histidine kinase [Gaiellaceae bacterium]|nr:sensor histidine kinase [Gaiellaceae bacterium]